jgi:hypothetical protein
MKRSRHVCRSVDGMIFVSELTRANPIHDRARDRQTLHPAAGGAAEIVSHRKSRESLFLMAVWSDACEMSYQE